MCRPRCLAQYAAPPIISPKTESQRHGVRVRFFPAGEEVPSRVEAGTGPGEMVVDEGEIQAATEMGPASGESLENYCVQPDVWVDNTPEDFMERRDRQIEQRDHAQRDQEQLERIADRALHGVQLGDVMMRGVRPPQGRIVHRPVHPILSELDEEDDQRGRYVEANGLAGLGPVGGERRQALQPFDLVLLEQIFDAAGELLDRIDTLRVHRIEIEAHAVDLDAKLGEPGLQGILDAANGILKPALDLVEDAFSLELLVAGRLADATEGAAHRRGRQPQPLSGALR